MYYKKYDEFNSLEGKSNAQGIKYRDGYLEWNKLKVKVNLKANDEYAHMALANKIKYCRIKRKLIRSKYKFYIQLVLEGIPPKKIDKETGMFKHTHGHGKVGIDTSTQIMAVSSENHVQIYELAPSIQNIEDKKRVLQRKLDRQRRANNPHKYNEDGTIKRDNKDKWIWSKNYIKTKNELNDYQRKLADVRKMEHYKLANEIVKLGNEFYYEKLNYKGLQARAKETTVNKNGKFNKKKRFGKSLANKAPSMFIEILKKKLSYWSLQLNEVNIYKLKASQYDHVTKEYNKVGLNERWKEVDGNTVQRDLYSAFLIMNVDGSLDKVNNELCDSNWNKFLELHDIEVNRLKDNNIRLNVL